MVAIQLGLYYKPTDSPYTQIAVPLRRISYAVEITGPVALFTLTQEYFNPLATPMNVDYYFPRSHGSTFYSFEALFKERRVLGKIKEKNQAKKEFEEHKAKGDFVAFAEMKDETPDIVKVELGNYPPGEPLSITFKYAEKLDLIANKLWKLVIPSTLTPRYKGQNSTSAEGSKTIKPSSSSVPDNYTLDNPYVWDIAVTILTKKKIEALFSSSHKGEISCDSHDQYTLVKLAEGKEHYPNKDFELMFCDPQMHEPQLRVMKTSRALDNPALPTVCAMMHLVPSFNDYATLGAEGLNKWEEFEEMGYLLEKVKGEYIFIIDRSGSMDGERIELAKKALIVALKSLPYDSYFNICSFGSSFTMMAPQSVKSSEQSINQAIQGHIQSISADMGGTEILQPLQGCFALQKIANYQRTIYLLTDGSVSNSNECIKATEMACFMNTNRVFSVGIGNGVSQEFIVGVSKAGNGGYDIILNESILEDKMVSLLKTSYSVSLTGFHYDFDKEKILALTPQYAEHNHLLKDKPLQIFALLKNGLTEPVPLTIKYFDQALNQQKTASFQINPSLAEEGELFHKLAIRELVESSKSIKQNYYADFTTMMTAGWQTSLPVSYQVLTPDTAFICVVEENNGNHSTAATTVTVPNPVSVDYQNSISAQVNQLQNLTCNVPPMQVYQQQQLLCSAPAQPQALHRAVRAQEELIQECRDMMMDRCEKLDSLCLKAEDLQLNSRGFKAEAKQKKSGGFLSGISSAVSGLFSSSKSKAAPPPPPVRAKPTSAARGPPAPMAPPVACPSPSMAMAPSMAMTPPPPPAMAYPTALKSCAVSNDIDDCLAADECEDIAEQNFDECLRDSKQCEEESFKECEKSEKKSVKRKSKKAAKKVEASDEDDEEAEDESTVSAQSTHNYSQATLDSIADNLLKQQKFEGFWSFNASLLSQLSTSPQSSLESTSGLSGDSLMTLVVVAWLKKYQAGKAKFNLILNKALGWIKKQGVQDPKDLETKILPLI